MTIVWGGGKPLKDAVNADNTISSQHFAPSAETPMTDEQRDMLSRWFSVSGKGTPAMLAKNLMLKFNLEKGKAWILAVRFINERRG